MGPLPPKDNDTVKLILVLVLRADRRFDQDWFSLI